MLPAGCEPPASRAEPLEVVAAWPSVEPEADDRRWGTQAWPVPLHLNSEVTVSFSADVDALTVTRDSVRMVKLTSEGPMRVEMARRRIGTRSVILEPEWPVTAELDDGTFQPGAMYLLIVEGFPLHSTVKSRTGVGVGERFLRYYQTVARDAPDPGPLLPVGLPSDSFRPTPDPLRLAAGARTIRLHFTLPPHPASVRPESFQVTVEGASEELNVPVAATRILTLRRPLFGSGAQMWAHPCTTVELQLAPHVPIQGGRFWVTLLPEGAEAHWIRDYRGRTLDIPPELALLAGYASPGQKVELIAIRPEVSARSGTVAVFKEEPVRTDLRFQTTEHGFRVLARKMAGRGGLGAFHPRTSTVLQAGGPFTTEDGRILLPRRQFEFTSIYIPRGVSVTLRSDQRVQLLSQTDIRIDGELLLETPHADRPQPFDRPEGDSYLTRIAIDRFGAQVLAAGTIEVRGAIRHLRTGEPMSSCLSLVARRIVLEGPIPRGTVRACEETVGTTQSTTQIRHVLEPGLPDHLRTRATARTQWHALPGDYVGSITVDARDVRGDLDVFVQVARPDPFDPALPYLEAGSLPEPKKLPLREPIEVQPGSHVRFLLEARVLAGKPLPQVAALIVFGD